MVAAGELCCLSDNSGYCKDFKEWSWDAYVYDGTMQRIRSHANLSSPNTLATFFLQLKLIRTRTLSCLVEKTKGLQQSYNKPIRG